MCWYCDVMWSVEPRVSGAPWPYNLVSVCRLVEFNVVCVCVKNFNISALSTIPLLINRSHSFANNGRISSTSKALPKSTSSKKRL